MAGVYSDIVKDNITKQRYETYEKYTEKLVINYILQHTKDTDRDNMRNFLHNQTIFNYVETLIYFCIAFDKAKDVTRILSFYLITKYSILAPYCAAIVEQDATYSGLQILVLLCLIKF